MPLGKRATLLGICFFSVCLFFRSSNLSNRVRDLIKDQWQHVYWLFGENDHLMHVFGTYSLLQLLYTVGNMFFAVPDLTGKPEWLRKYKIQPEKNFPIDKWKYLKALKLSAFNSFVVFIGICAVLGTILWLRNVPCSVDSIPSLPQLLFHLLFFIIVEEIGFYYIHKTLHHPFFYTRIHKIHHEWVTPISITQYYCHPIEHIVLNSVPTVSGSILLGDNFNNHIISWFVWLILFVISSIVLHSGYHLPFLTSPEEHDFHHSRFSQNYGTLGLLDYLHGTSKAFLKNIAYKRHFVLIGLSSVRELVPDDPSDVTAERSED